MRLVKSRSAKGLRAPVIHSSTMHKTPLFQASRIFPALAALLLVALSGCSSVTVTNLTPDTVPQNPSQIYTVTASFHPTTRTDPSSIRPRIVIDAQAYDMTRSQMGADIWEFEYQLPAGRSAANYYFICDYQMKGNSDSHEVTSDLQNLSVAGRYVIRPEASRAPVGSRVSVLGAGFTTSDLVYFDSTPTRTIFESPSSLSFFVPAVAPNRSYRLSIRGSTLALDVGTFRVDAISFQVTPSALVLRSGEQQAVTFTIPQPAPAGGLLIDVTTDVKESVVMPEVIVPANSTSVTIPVQGGKPGSGSLYFRSSAGEGSIPVTVTAG